MNAPAFQLRTSDLPPVNTFTRSLAARVIASIERKSAAKVLEERWPHDRITAEMIERATSAPAMTTVTGWAAELAQKKIVDTLGALYTQSAAAKIFAQATVLSFDGAGAISVPGFVASSLGVKGFIAEGNPIPVQQLALSTPAILLPTKAAGIIVLTREMIESSNAEILIKDAALRMLGRRIDEVIFDANPADPARPRGLRNGVAITPASPGTDPWSSSLGDIGALADAVSPVAGAGDLVYIGSAGRAIKASVYSNGADLSVFGSGAVINDFLCLALDAFVVAIGDPAVESSGAATLHMDDTPNIDVSHAGRGVSMYQTDSVAIKLRWPISWAARDVRAFAWTTPTGW